MRMGVYLVLLICSSRWRWHLYCDEPSTIHCCRFCLCISRVAVALHTNRQIRNGKVVVAAVWQQTFCSEFRINVMSSVELVSNCGRSTHSVDVYTVYTSSFSSTTDGWFHLHPCWYVFTFRTMRWIFGTQVVRTAVDSCNCFIFSMFRSWEFEVNLCEFISKRRRGWMVGCFVPISEAINELNVQCSCSTSTPSWFLGQFYRKPNICWFHEFISNNSAVR